LPLVEYWIGAMNLMNWEAPLRSMHLEGREIHVWMFGLDQPGGVVERLGKRLSSDELERAARFHFAVDRKRWQVCRGLLRSLLGRYVEARPEELVFRYGPRGKPYLVPVSAARIEFSVAHSANRALFAFCRDTEIGVDLEHDRPLADLAGMMQACLSAQEQVEMQELPEQQRSSAFFQVWVRKEALIKATGKGMMVPLREFDVGVNPEGIQNELQLPAEHFSDQPWRIIDLPTPTEFFGAMAVTGANRRVRCYEGSAEALVG
jgi:4'-phosphopantetheinyl transferase